MSIEVQIRKKLGSFLLDISFQSRARRIGILGASGWEEHDVKEHCRH